MKHLAKEIILISVVLLFSCYKENKTENSEKPNPSLKSPPLFYVTTLKGLNLRSEPSLDSTILNLAPFKSKLTLIGKTKKKEWVQVKFQDTLGFVSTDYITDIPFEKEVKKEYNNDSSLLYILESKKFSNDSECSEGYQSDCILKIIKDGKLIFSEGPFGNPKWVTNTNLSYYIAMGECGWHQHNSCIFDAEKEEIIENVFENVSFGPNCYHENSEAKYYYNHLYCSNSFCYKIQSNKLELKIYKGDSKILKEDNIPNNFLIHKIQNYPEIEDLQFEMEKNELIIKSENKTTCLDLNRFESIECK
jgi:hypothetical protein